LAAIRSFFRLVALRDPDSVDLATRVLAIPIKRCDKPLVGYLTQPEMEAILAVPDLSLWTGQRDHALLLTMYNSGARVSEITSLSWRQVRFGTTTYLDLKGKGRKERSVPLWPKTAKVTTNTPQPLGSKNGSIRIFFGIRSSLFWPAKESSAQNCNCSAVTRRRKVWRSIGIWLWQMFQMSTNRRCDRFRSADAYWVLSQLPLCSPDMIENGSPRTSTGWNQD
jgi:hypothetical protein